MGIGIDSMMFSAWSVWGVRRELRVYVVGFRGNTCDVRMNGVCVAWGLVRIELGVSVVRFVGNTCDAGMSVA